MKPSYSHHAYDGRARKRQAGLSLIEATAFLALAGLVIAGALMMYNAAQVEQQTSQTVAEFEAFRTGVKSLYGSQTYPTTAATPMPMHSPLINGRRYPSTVTVDTTNYTFTNAFGDSVTVHGDTVGGNNLFYVSYDSVPRAVCMGLLTNVTRNSDWTHYEVVLANTTASPEAANTVPAGGITVSTANNNCNQDRVRVTLWSR